MADETSPDTKPLGEIIKGHTIRCYCYADDKQVCVAPKPGDKWDDISSYIEACIGDISIWMNGNMMKFNKDRTEFIVFSSKQHVKKTENHRI